MRLKYLQRWPDTLSTFNAGSLCGGRGSSRSSSWFELAGKASGLSRAPAPLALHTTSEPGKPRAKTMLFIPDIINGCSLVRLCLGADHPFRHSGVSSVATAGIRTPGDDCVPWSGQILMATHIPAIGDCGPGDRFACKAHSGYWRDGTLHPDGVLPILVALQFVEMYPELKRFRNVLENKRFKSFRQTQSWMRLPLPQRDRVCARLRRPQLGAVGPAVLLRHQIQSADQFVSLARTLGLEPGCQDREPHHLHSGGMPMDD